MESDEGTCLQKGNPNVPVVGTVVVLHFVNGTKGRVEIRTLTPFGLCLRQRSGIKCEFNRRIVPRPLRSRNVETKRFLAPRQESELGSLGALGLQRHLLVL